MRKTNIAFISITASLVFGIAGTWWWALFGMRTEVGVAVAVTSTILFFLGLATADSSL